MLAAMSPGKWTNIRFSILALLALTLSGKLVTAQAGGASFSGAAVSWGTIAAAKHSCSNVRNSILLNPDRSILCFDGPIRADLDLGPLHDLRQGGFFVVRSTGGWGHVAMTFPSILRDKDAIVILHGHCLSACARYIFAATDRTVVTTGTIVAWHTIVTDYDRSTYTTCKEAAAAWLRTYGELLGRPSIETLCNAGPFPSVSFRDGQIGNRQTREPPTPRMVEPPTPHIRKLWRLALAQHGDVGRLFWTWHPKNHGDYFKLRIIYESYPSEEEVQKFFQQTGSRVFYDPDPGS